MIKNNISAKDRTEIKGHINGLWESSTMNKPIYSCEKLLERHTKDCYKLFNVEQNVR